MSVEQPLTFMSAGEQVVGMWHAPQGVAGAASAVVLCHGFTGNKAESHRLFVEMARALAESGWGALRFDFRGSGDSAGRFVDMSVSGEVADTHAALAYVRQRPDVNPDQVLLLGLSMGGMVAALTAGGDPAIRAVVLWNPVAHAMGIAERRRSEQHEQQLTEQGVADYQGWAVGAPFLQELARLDPVSAMAEAAPATLVCLGGQDEAVPNEEGLAYAEALRMAGASVTVHTVSEAGHTFESLPAKAEVIARTLAWIKAHGRRET